VRADDEAADRQVLCVRELSWWYRTSSDEVRVHSQLLPPFDLQPIVDVA